MKWFSSKDIGKSFRVYWLDGQVLEGKLVNIENIIYFFEFIDGTKKRFKDEKIDYIDDIDVLNESEESKENTKLTVSTDNNKYELYSEVLQDAQKLFNNEKYIETNKFIDRHREFKNNVELKALFEKSKMEISKKNEEDLIIDAISDSEDISKDTLLSLKELNKRISYYQQYKNFNDLINYVDSILLLYPNFDFKVNLLEAKAQAFCSLEELENAELVYEDLIKIVAIEVDNRRYTHLLSMLINVQIQNNHLTSAANNLTLLASVDSESKSYQYFYNRLVALGYITRIVDKKQDDFIKLLNDSIIKTYTWQENIEDLKDVLQNKQYEKINKYFNACKSKSKQKHDFVFSSGNMNVAILTYNLNLFVLTAKNYPKVFDYLLCEILKINKKEYYKYYCVFPPSVEIIRSDIVLAFRNNDVYTAYFYMEHLFTHHLLSEEIKDIWFEYVKNSVLTKSIEGLKYQLKNFSKLSKKFQELIIESIQYMNNEMQLNLTDAQYQDINLFNFESYLQLVNTRLKTDVIYTRAHQQLQPVEGYKRNLKEFQDSFNYYGAYKYIEMINQIWKNTNNEVLTLKEEFEALKSKLDSILTTHYLPRDDSYYYNGMISLFVEDAIEKAEEFFLKSIETDEKHKEYSILYLVETFSEINPKKALSYYEEYKPILKMTPKSDSESIIKIELIVLEIEQKQENFDEVLRIISSIFNRFEGDLASISKYIKRDKISALCLHAAKAYLNKERSYSKALKFLDDAKEYGLSEKTYNYHKALCLIGMQNLNEAKIILEENTRKFDDEDSRILLNTDIFIQNKTNDFSNKQKVEQFLLNQSKNIFQNDTIRNFIDIFTRLYCANAEKGLKALKAQTEDFNNDDLVKILHNIENSDSLKDQSDYSLRAALVFQALNDKENFHKHIVNSVVYLISYLNFSNEFNLAKQYSIFYFVLTQDGDGNFLSVLRVFLDSLLQRQVHNDGSLRKNILNALDEISLENIHEIIYPLYYNIQFQRFCSKEFNRKRLNKFLNIINLKFELSLESFVEIIENFGKLINADLNKIEKDLTLISTYDLNDRDMSVILDKLILNIPSTSDQQYLNKYKNLLEELLQINDLIDFQQKKYLIKNTEYEAKFLLDNLEKNPSFLSVGFLFDNINNIFIKKLKLFEKDFIKLHLPKLSIYLPTNSQFTIQNDKVSSEAKNIAITVKDSSGNQISQEYCTSLLGDQSDSFELDLEFSQYNIHTLKFEITYDNILGESETLYIERSVDMKENDAFIDIINDYGISGAVEDSHMFYGRHQLIKKLTTLIKNDRNRCVILYGQKRAGKSSTFYHLQKELIDESYIAIRFSMGEVGDSFESFIKAIVRGIEEYYENTSDNDIFQMTGIYFSSIKDVNDLIHFIKKSLKYINQDEQSKELILLIDEFTYIYGAIKKGLYPENFMKYWKAMLEKNVFKALLIGQDSMPEFIAEYPNEFGVIEKERITYLDRQSAVDLIVQPILQNGESRYIENSVEMILKLSAGSPYYIQKICHEIVNYLNNKKTNIVTNFAVKEVVNNHILGGNNSVTLDFFDNLFSLGEGEDEYRKNQRFKLLIAIANKQNIEKYTNDQKLIDELISREVIEMINQSQYEIKVGLFEQFLLKNYGVI
jgi:hypothetical protein